MNGWGSRDTHTQWIIIQPYKKKEILLFATTWMDLDGIILSEIEVRQRKTNKYMTSLVQGMKKLKTPNANHYHNHQNKIKLVEKGVRFVGLPEVSNGGGGPDEGGQNVQLPVMRQVPGM